MDIGEFGERCAALIRAAPGSLSVALLTSTGARWGHESQRVVPAASTIKIPVLLAALAGCAEGRLTLDDVVPLPVARVGGGGALSLLPSVTSLPLRELLALMVAVSDNDATNAVLDRVGPASVAGLLARVPTRHTVLERRMMDFAAAGRGRQNETSAADMVATLSALRRGLLLPPELTAEALAVLRGQQFREGIPAYLPETVTVASKTGELFGVRHDVALLERGGSWLAVAVLATGLARGDVDRGTAVLPTFAAIGELAAGML